MEDLFKKFVNAGVGYLAQGNKKVQSTIEALVKDSKITEQEGKKIVDDLLKSSETKRTELEKQFKGLTDRVKDTVGLGDKPKKAPAKKKSPAAKTATSKVAGATKKAADEVSAAAGSAQRSAAAKAGAAKAPAKPKAAKKSASAPADGGHQGA